jgi:hypothetical protein
VAGPVPDWLFSVLFGVFFLYIKKIVAPFFKKIVALLVELRIRILISSNYTWKRYQLRLVNLVVN